MYYRSPTFSFKLKGAKKKFLQHILSLVPLNATVIEPFMGSGTVTYALASRGQKVICNDAGYWSYCILRALKGIDVDLGAKAIALIEGTTIDNARKKLEKFANPDLPIEPHHSDVFDFLELSLPKHAVWFVDTPKVFKRHPETVYVDFDKIDAKLGGKSKVKTPWNIDNVRDMYRKLFEGIKRHKPKMVIVEHPESVSYTHLTLPTTERV